MELKSLISAICILSISGCATYGGYQPTVDTYGDRNVRYLQQDGFECEQLAKQSGSMGSNVAKDALGGALLGAAGGAIAGAFLGNAGTGAAVGAAAGGFGGAATGGLSSDDQFKRAYRNCMRNRGHNVID